MEGSDRDIFKLSFRHLPSDLEKSRQISAGIIAFQTTIKTATSAGLPTAQREQTWRQCESFRYKSVLEDARHGMD